MLKWLRSRAEEPMEDRDLSGRTLGEFVLLEKIGQGGYAAVYRSEQPLLKRHVVVKVLRKHDDVAEQRFLQEARLASRFDHPFAAHVYAFGVDEDEDLLWIAMELVQGVTLAEQRFLQEARLASRFDHPFAAHVYAFGVDEDEDLLWIAMELVQGVTLAD